MLSIGFRKIFQKFFVLAIPAHYARDCRVSCARAAGRACVCVGACYARILVARTCRRFARFFAFWRFPPIRGKDYKNGGFCPLSDSGRGCPIFAHCGRVFGGGFGGCGLVWWGVCTRSRSLAHGLRIAEKPRTAHGLRVSACLPLVSVSAVVSVRQILSF